MARTSIFLALLGVTALGGCARYTLYRPTQSGQVYVVRHKWARSDVVYSCDARNVDPVCFRTQEVARP